MKKLLIPIFLMIAAAANAQEVMPAQKTNTPANTSSTQPGKTAQAPPDQSKGPAQTAPNQSKAPGTSLRPGHASQAQKKAAAAPAEKPVEKK